MEEAYPARQAGQEGMVHRAGLLALCPTDPRVMADHPLPLLSVTRHSLLLQRACLLAHRAVPQQISFLHLRDSQLHHQALGPPHPVLGALQATHKHLDRYSNAWV